MKRYEKPMLTALSLSGNDQLCGYCSEKNAPYLLYNDPDLAARLMTFYGFGSGEPDAGDFSNVFGANEGCTEGLILDYCKFSSVDEGKNLIAWS